MSDESPEAKKHGHGAGAREKRLRALAHWPEIEVRLQHRWSPDRVLDWHIRAYPGEAVPPRRTVYRFLEDQTESWFVPQLWIQQADTKHVPRILVLERQANLIETQVLRLNKALPKETAMDDGYLSPEVRANIDLLDRLLHRHFVTQQDVGLEPKVTHGGKAAADPDDRDDAEARERAALVHRIVNLPVEEFMPAVIAILGPPPIKQPLQLAGEVIEMKPIESNGTAPGGP